MEHIPKVTSGVFGQNIAPVPLLVRNNRYGNLPRGVEGFRKYPLENGYTSLGFKNVNGVDEPEISFIQSWLFFGLLAETFGGSLTEFKAEEFVDISDPSNPVLTTKALQKYVWYWQAIQVYETIDDSINHGRRVDGCLQVACEVVNSAVRIFRLPSSTPISQWPPKLVCLLSIIALGEYICAVREKIIMHTRTRLGVLNLQWEFPFINSALSAAGWCDGEVLDLARSNNITCRYYLSTVDRHILEKDHTKCKGKTSCQAYMVDYSTYRTLHTKACLASGSRDCTEIGPPADKVAEVLRSGDFPVVIHDPDGIKGSSEVRMATSKSVERYVAMSHVWSDGLGNQDRNCLQRCQYIEIQKLVNDLYDPSVRPVHFWMDTLCVPVGKVYKDAKIAAISRMAETYRLADKVLVLDSSLRHCSGDMSRAETMIRLSHCPWLSRVWTLQEGRLARGLYIQYPNGPLMFDEVNDPTKNNRHLLGLSKMLKEADPNYRRTNPCARRLILALSSGRLSKYQIMYAQMPPQDDPDEEELRLGAIKELQNRAEENKLAEIWSAEVAEAGLQSDNPQIDDHLRVSIEASEFCTVMEKATIALRKIQGSHESVVPRARQALLANRSIDLGADITPTLLLTNVCRAFTGRTTTRIEDESLCLSILLGADPTKILSISPVEWRTREILSILESNSAFRQAVTDAGFRVQNEVDVCQSTRMKVLLSQIKVFPSSIIFWDCSRLRTDGWKWGPLSVLQAKWPIDDPFDNTFAKLTRFGLALKMPGILLNGIVEKSLSTLTIDGNENAEEVLIIHTPEDGDPEARGMGRSWQRLALVHGPASNPFIQKQSWSSLRDSGSLVSMAVLVQRNRGLGLLVLVEKRGKSSSTVHHSMLVRRVKENLGRPDSKQIHVNGVWDTEHEWCIR